MRQSILVFIVILLYLPLVAQGPSLGLIQGIVVDDHTQEPIPYANIVASGQDTSRGTVSDLSGNFSISVPLGRFEVRASYVGYKDVWMDHVLIGSAISANIEMAMQESAFDLDEVLVKPMVNKKKAKNNFALLSSRLLSVEEATRYAGGFEDPARLASAFAGVSSRVGTNGISIRGNAPKYLLWNMEGIEIPNPNHFANLSVFGGGGLTALSSQVLDNTDFMTGAMPAGYSNALSGVFDLSMRSGNHDQHHPSIQMGLIGLDAASEGPLNKQKKSSYLLNYRYSTLAAVQSLLPEEAQGISYQDLSFKLSFPSLTKGTVEWWGLGLVDQSGQSPVLDEDLRLYKQDLLDQDVRQYMGASGIKYLKYIDNDLKQVVRTQLAFSISNTDLQTGQLTDDDQLAAKNQINNRQFSISFNSSLSTRFSKQHTNETGLKLRLLGYNLSLAEATIPGKLSSVLDQKGQSGLTTFYSNSSISVSSRTTLVGGLSLQYFGLTKKSLLEPRLSLTYQVSDRVKTGLGYGAHSRIEPLHHYLLENNSGTSGNKDLRHSRAHHWVLNLEWSPSPNYLVKVEPYYQKLFDIPVTTESNLSLINIENDWFLDEKLVNSGGGRNMGIDLTFERYMTRGFYSLVAASIFDSNYNMDGGPWLDTRYNLKYVGNVLIGKEFTWGKESQSSLNINWRTTLLGGQPYQQIDESLSLESDEIIFDNESLFNNRFQTGLIHHFTINYQVSRPNITHAFSLKILNVGGYEEFVDFRINQREGRVDTYREALIIPN